MQAKKKSLGRRKTGDTDGLNTSLEHLIQQASLTLEFLKKMSNGVAEGRQLYDRLVEMADNISLTASISPAFWERALKAVGFEDAGMKIWQGQGRTFAVYSLQYSLV